MTQPINEGDPRYSLTQDMIEGDAARQNAAAVKLKVIDKLIQDAQDLAAHLTKTLIPEDLQAAGYRFEFSTTPILFIRETKT